MKSGNLNFLEPSGHSRPVTGLLYLYLYWAKLEWPVRSIKSSRTVTLRGFYGILLLQELQACEFIVIGMCGLPVKRINASHPSSALSI